MHPMTPGRYPLLTGAVVVAAALLLLQQAVCCWYGTVSIALCLAWLLHSVGSSIGRGYTKELWRERRERLVYHTSKRVEALPFRQREQGVVLSVVAPCFNEAERIGRMLEETADYLKPRGSAWELIVVDDGSTDDSIEVALAAAKSLGIDDNVKVVPIKPNHGKGYVVKQGVFASSGDYILMADADAATDITELGSLEKYLKDHESEGMGVVIGSRAHMEEESKATRSPFRLLLMHIFHFCVAFTFAFSYKHTELQDTQCGFKLFSRKAALATFSNLHLERWSFDVELVCHLLPQNGAFRCASPPYRQHTPLAAGGRSDARHRCGRGPGEMGGDRGVQGDREVHGAHGHGAAPDMLLPEVRCVACGPKYRHHRLATFPERALRTSH